MKVKNEKNRTKTRIKQGDIVLVITGRDRGKKGKVLRLDHQDGYAYIERVNIVKKATRPNQYKQIKGGIVDKESKIHISNIRMVCPSCNDATKMKALKQEGRGTARVCKKCNEVIA